MIRPREGKAYAFLNGCPHSPRCGGVKLMKNLNLKFSEKGQKVIFWNSPGGKAGIVLDLG